VATTEAPAITIANNDILNSLSIFCRFTPVMGSNGRAKLFNLLIM
jgi:hypothetical protein